MPGYDPANDSWTSQFSQPQAAVNPTDPASSLTAAWSSAAPSLPVTLLQRFAAQGISPADPVGSWLIKTGVPALNTNTPIGNNMTTAYAASRVLGNPSLLAEMKKLPLDKQTEIFQMSVPQAGALSDQQLLRLAQSGSTSVHHGFFNKIGDIATDAIRGATTIAAAPLEGITATYRGIMANRPLGDVLALGLPEVLRMAGHPIQGKGGLRPADILAQTELGQALYHGKDLGQGFLPGGTAHTAAVQAQRAAANINGSALTPGRAFASTVTEQGTTPYNIMSGVVDATAAIKADPTALVLGEISDVAKTARTFAPTSDAARLSVANFLHDGANSSEAIGALRDWSGLSKAEEPNLINAMTQKLKADPGSLQNLIGHPALNLTQRDIAGAVGRDHVGAIQAFRNLVNPKDAMSWLNSQAGIDYTNKVAGQDFYDIWRQSNKKLPVDVAAALGDARTPDEVRTVLGQSLSTLVRGVPEGVMPYAWKRPIEDMRLFQYLPRGFVDMENPDNAVEQVRRMLVNAKVDPKFYSPLLSDIAKAGTRSDFYDAYTRATEAIKDTLVTRGVEPNLARTLARFQPEGTIEDAARWVDEVGTTPHISGMTSGGDTIPLAGPHLSSELLNRALPVLDMRAIDRSVGTWGDIWNHPVLGPVAKGATYTADALTNTFKAFTLLKLALPTRFLADEQARMATSGMDSMFHHPLSYIAHVIGHNIDEDALGVKWADQLADHQSAYRRAVGESAKWSDSIFDADKQLAKHYVTYDWGSPEYTRAWADELSHLHVTPESREVARALEDVAYAPAGIDASQHAGLDGVKEWFWSGAGQKYRQDLAAANLWQGTSNELADSRQAADGFIESVVDRVKLATSEDPELMHAVAQGGPFGLNGIDKDFISSLRSAQNVEGLGPQQIRGRAVEELQGRPRVLHNMVDRMLGALMDTPTSKLTRAPAFKQTYLSRFDELLPHINDGTITAEKADTIAKSYALQEVKKLLYYPGERMSVTDKLRNVAPFGEAWRNVLVTWSKLAAENPQVLRRAQQGVTSLKSSGFFYQDPQSGKEVFTLVPSGIMKHLTGVPFPITAPVQGVNIVGSGLPGIGPALQIPVDALMPKGNIVTDTLRQHLLPYGSPDYTGGFFETLFPGWADKLRTSGFLLHYLPGNPSLPFLTPSADKKRVLGDLAKSVFSYHMSAGHYDLSNPDVLDRLSKQSMWEAQKLYLVRSLAQFAAPAAPNTVAESQLKNGSLMETWMLSKDFQTMEKAYGSLDNATLAFVNKYGPQAVFATEPFARRAIFGVPTTEEASIWRSQHSDFAAKFPTTYGYWAPTQGQFSYQAYLDGIKRGDIVAPSVTDWAKLAEARLGNAIYSTLRARLPVSPNQTQRDWLAAQKSAITAQYPGFNDDSLKLQRKTLDQTVDELRDAVLDPAVGTTPLAYAAKTYIDLRDQALAEARRRTGSTTSGITGKSMSDLRAWLYQNGQKIALQYPDFQGMWERLFLNEVQPPQENQ